MKGSWGKGNKKDRAGQEETKMVERKEHTFSMENFGETLSSRSSLHTGLFSLGLGNLPQGTGLGG